LCRVDNLVDEGWCADGKRRPAQRLEHGQLCVTGVLAVPGEDSPYGVARMGLVTDLDVKAKADGGVDYVIELLPTGAKCP
jgi:hypothetical protein